MENPMENVLRSLRYLLAETEKKIAQIRNREFGRDIVDDISLKDYVTYFESTISGIKNEIHSIKNTDPINTEFQALSLIDISHIIKKSPFNIFAIFNDYLGGGRAEISKMHFNDEILKSLISIETHCKNLIYFLNLQD
jgi:hypothetical protein